MRGYKPDGTRNYLNFTGATEAECREKYLDFQLDERTFGRTPAAEKRRISLERFAEVFKTALDDEVTRKRITARTATFYKENVDRYVVPALGKARLRDVTGEHLDALYTAHAGKPRTAQAVHQTLRRLFKTAVRYHYLARSPVPDADAPTYKSPERTPPTGAQLRVLLDKAEAKGPAVGAWFALACTGMRPGEILGLSRGALHLDDARAEIVLARETRGRPEEKTLKSEKARRSLPLTRRAVALLRRHLETQSADKVVALDAPVFATRGVGAISYRNAYRWWPKLREAAKLPEGTRPYDCRHAYATELLAEGVPLHEVSWLMGHASVHFTADVYGHRVKRRDEAARSALERALGDG
jgi:integrase